MSYFTDGLYYFKNQDYIRAIDLFRFATKEDGSNAKIWNALGTALSKIGQYEEADRCFFKARTLCPENELFLKNVKEKAKDPQSMQKQESDYLMELKGITGQIKLYPDKIVISRNGLGRLSYGFQGDKSIYFRDISSVQFKQASLFLNGYISFSLPGGIEKKGLSDSTSDENAVVFTIDQKKVALEMKSKIESLISQSKNPYPFVKGDIAENIRKFKELLDEGIITEQEFKDFKSKLLG